MAFKINKEIFVSLANSLKASPYIYIWGPLRRIYDFTLKHFLNLRVLQMLGRKTVLFVNPGHLGSVLFNVFL